MNRADWEAKVFASNMNPTARMVCIALGSYGQWNADKEVWPSIEDGLVGRVGASRETVGKYLAALKEQGWIRHERTLQSNTKVWSLHGQDAPVTGILAKSDKATKNLPVKSTTATPAPSTADDGCLTVRQPDCDHDGCLSNDSTTGCLTTSHRLSSDSTSGCLTVRQEDTNEAVREDTREDTTTVADAPVELEEVSKSENTTDFLNPPDLPVSSLVIEGGGEAATEVRLEKTTDTSPNLPDSRIATSAGATVAVIRRREIVDEYCKWTRWANVNDEFKEEMKTRIYDPNWLPEESDPKQRVNETARLIHQERMVTV